MDRINNILNELAEAAQKTHDGKKRSDLKNSDFLFPETKSFPIVSPSDVKDAISNFGRMKSDMSYDTFLKKLYNFCKDKGPEFIAALPEVSKDKLGIKSHSDMWEKCNCCGQAIDYRPLPDTMYDNQNTDNAPDEMINADTNLVEYQTEFLEMAVSSLKNILHNVTSIINHLGSDTVKDNLTEPWLQGMIAITEDNMSTIHDFVMLNEEIDDETSEAGNQNKSGLWDNIRKKKERMGKRYRPAKPGDKDRPDPKTWTKLTKDSEKSK